jgi:hypothetical protein
MRRFAPLLLLAAAPLVAEPVPAGQGWTAAQIPWQTEGAHGTRFALLEGRREQPGTAFTYAFSIPAGVWDAPHSHSAAARVFVAKGTLRIGYGASNDKAAARSYPAGSYVLVPAGAVHYDGADVDTVIIGTAVGPWSTSYLDGSAPASAGTPIQH